MPESLAELIATLPQQGVIEWIGLRREKRGRVESVHATVAEPGTGLVGDHFSATRSDREVSLIQAEHLSVLAELMNTGPIDPASLRRNIVVRGINLLALRSRRFRVGEALLEFSGLAVPCSRMETTLGPGGYNAMRGHGGITAKVISGGAIEVGAAVTAAEMLRIGS